jgi:hypothetical protein
MNFKRMGATNATAPYTFFSGGFAAGSTTGASCQYTPGSYQIIYTTVTPTQYGYTAALSPIYFMFDLCSTPALP